MNNAPEFSGSGDPIYRHTPPATPAPIAIGDSENIVRITRHIETHLGPVTTVFHELVSTDVHIDVHIVAPTAERPFYTLVTSGMSDRAMTVPTGAEHLAYAELALCLPPDWPMTEADWQDENNYWPIRALKTLARFPHEYQTWLCLDHTVPHGNPATPYAPDCPFSCALLSTANTAPLEFATLVLSPQKTIYFFGVVFIYPEELQFKLESGAEPLVEALETMGHCELVDLARESVIE